MVLYVFTALVAGVTVLSLSTGFPDLWPDGYELTTFLGITLLVFAVGLVAIIDYLLWPSRRRASAGVRMMSVIVVAVGFITGYLVGSQISVRFQSGGSMDEVVDVMGPGDPLLSVALAILMACVGAMLVWLGIRPARDDS